MVTISKSEDFSLHTLEDEFTPTVDVGKFNTFLNNLPPPELSEMQVLMSSKPVVLNGMLFTLHFAGDDLLKVQTPNLDEAKFNELKNWLEDEMTQIDKAHSDRRYNGASSWEGSGTRLRENETDASEDAPARSRSIKIRAFPRSFSNTMARIKEQLVYERLRNCIQVETYTSGRFKQCIYLLPYNNAPKMVKCIEEANSEVHKLNIDIQEYVTGPEYRSIRGILEHFEMASILDRRSWTVPSIRYEVMPLALNPDVVMNYVKMGEQTVNEKLQADYREGAKLLQVELERKSRDLAAQVLTSLKKDLDEHVHAVVSKMKTDPGSVKANLDALKAKAACVNLESLANTVIAPLEMLIDNPERAKELFGVDELCDVKGEVEDRFTALLRSLP